MKDEALDDLLTRIPDVAARTGPCIDDGLLLAYREGRLSQDELSRIDGHLASCTDCRDLLAEFKEVPVEVRNWARSTLVRPFRWPKMAAVSMVITGAVTTFAIGLVVISNERDTHDLPLYTLIGPTGGMSATRGAAEKTTVFTPSSLFKVVLRPLARVTLPVSMLVFVENAEGRLRIAPPALEAPGTWGASGGMGRAGEGGTFRYELQAGRLFGSDYGRRTIHIVVISGNVDFSGFEGTRREITDRLHDFRWMTADVIYQPSED